jgi:hypothetical protein
MFLGLDFLQIQKVIFGFGAHTLSVGGEITRTVQKELIIISEIKGKTGIAIAAQ